MGEWIRSAEYQELITQRKTIGKTDNPLNNPLYSSYTIITMEPYKSIICSHLPTMLSITLHNIGSVCMELIPFLIRYLAEAVECGPDTVGIVVLTNSADNAHIPKIKHYAGLNLFGYFFVLKIFSKSNNNKLPNNRYKKLTKVPTYHGGF